MRHLASFAALAAASSSSAAGRRSMTSSPPPLPLLQPQLRPPLSPAVGSASNLASPGGRQHARRVSSLGGGWKSPSVSPPVLLLSPSLRR